MGVPLVEQGGVFFDPANSVFNPFARLWVDLIYDTMIHDTIDGKGAPGLATKWSTPDPQTVELTLRTAKFADGTPFNSQAVKAAWERLLAATQVATIPPEIKAVTSIDTPDDTTVRVHLSQPVAQTWIDDTLRNSFWLGVPSPAAAQAGTLNTKPVGAGPYQLDNYQESQKITLKKNPRFYDPKAQKLAGVELIEAAAGQSSLTALQGGTVDLIVLADPSAIQTVKSAGFVVTSRPGIQVSDFGLCVSDGPFASKKARQAVQYAVDRKGINAAASAGQGTPTILPVTGVSPFYNKSLEKTYSYNPKKAKALLEQAGVKPGTTVRALVSTNPVQAAISQIVQSNLEAIGLKMEITSSTNVPADAARLRPDITFAAITPDLWSLAFANPAATTLNICGWKSTEAASALDTARDSSKTPADRQKAYDTLQKILLDESPDIFTVVQPLLAAHTKNVKGVEVIHTIIGADLSTVYIAK